jgi:hypothetical protein
MMTSSGPDSYGINSSGPLFGFTWKLEPHSLKRLHLFFTGGQTDLFTPVAIGHRERPAGIAPTIVASHRSPSGVTTVAGKRLTPRILPKHLPQLDAGSAFFCELAYPADVTNLYLVGLAQKSAFSIQRDKAARHCAAGADGAAGKAARAQRRLNALTTPHVAAPLWQGLTDTGQGHVDVANGPRVVKDQLANFRLGAGVLIAGAAALFDPVDATVGHLPGDAHLACRTVEVHLT